MTGQYDSLISGRRNIALREAIQHGALNFTYKGHPCWKDPFDLALYSMLLWREKRKTIIEIGSAFGGSGLWFRDMQVAMEIRPCVVISIDQNPPHSEISGLGFLKGDAHDLASVLPQEWLANGLSRRLLVVVVGRRRPGCWPAMRSARCARRC